MPEHIDLLRFHIFKKDESYFLYSPASKGYTEISENLARHLKKSPDELQATLRNIPLANETLASAGGIATVYLNVSSACNLKCVYCYANRGQYQEAEKPMSIDTIEKTLNYFLNKKLPLGHFTFFGGEPLLRFRLIQDAVEHIKRFSLHHGWPAPEFSIITNAVYLDEIKINFLAQANFNITISVDGPAKIHDFLRPDTKNQGSFALIDQNILKLLAQGITPSIEATYTQEHIKRGVTPKKLLEFFQNRYRTKVAIVSPAGGGKDDPWKVTGQEVAKDYIEAAKYSLDSILSKSPIRMQNIFMILSHLRSNLKRPSHQYCYANLGEDHFAISAAGEIYPCQMFNEQKDFQLGHVDSSKDDLSLASNHDKLQLNSRELNQCKGCWAKEVCFICPGGVYLETKQVKKIPKHRCDLVKALAEEAIAHLAKMKKEPEKEKNFFNKLQQF